MQFSNGAGSMAQFIQSLMSQRPDLAQALASMMQRSAGGLGQLAGGQQGGPMPARFGMGTDPGGSNLLARLPTGGMPSMGPPPSYGGQPPQGGMWGMQRPSMQPPMASGAGGGYNMQAGGVRPGGAMPGFQGAGPTLPYGQRFNMNPGQIPQPMPMPTGNPNPGTPPPYRAPAFSAPQTPPSPGAFSSPALAQNGAVGLDWYAQQAGA